MRSYGRQASSLKGFPDILVLYRGQFVGVELKTGTNLRESQKKCRDRIDKAQGRYVVVRSLSQLSAYLKEILQTLPLSSFAITDLPHIQESLDLVYSKPQIRRVLSQSQAFEFASELHSKAESFPAKRRRKAVEKLGTLSQAKSRRRNRQPEQPTTEIFLIQK